MGQLADLISQDKKPGRLACGVSLLFAALPKADAADLRAALADASVAGTTISRALTTLGHSVKGQTIQRHRRGECGCGTPS